MHINKIKQLLLVVCVVFAGYVHATDCTKDIDCHGVWEEDNCVCGVHAMCQGITQQTAKGYCQCLGKQGSCHPSMTDSTSGVRSANPIRRGIAPRNTK